jgi:hypothetical protein
MTPYYGQTALSFAAAQQTLQLTYSDTLLYYERGGVASTGLDALGVRPAQSGYPTSQLADPPLPIPSTSFNHLSLDLEGLALASDGTCDIVFRYFSFLFSNHSGCVAFGLATSMGRTSNTSTDLAT